MFLSFLVDNYRESDFGLFPESLVWQFSGSGSFGLFILDLVRCRRSPTKPLSLNPQLLPYVHHGLSRLGYAALEFTENDAGYKHFSRIGQIRLNQFQWRLTWWWHEFLSRTIRALPEHLRAWYGMHQSET